MNKADFPLDPSEIAATLEDRKTYLRFPLQKTKQLYGFGLNSRRSINGGRSCNYMSIHYGGRDNGRTHAPTPFYVSSKGYGVLSIPPAICRSMPAAA